MGGRDRGDPLSRREVAMAGAAGEAGKTQTDRAATAPTLPATGSQDAGSPVAKELPEYATAGTTGPGSRRRTAFRGLRLRSALNARLRLAGLRSGRGHGKQLPEQKNKRGHFY